jgi:hypothetical protein
LGSLNVLPQLLVVGVFVVDRLTAAHEKLSQQEKQLEMINRELKHRIKKPFGVAISKPIPLYSGAIHK